MAKVNLTKRVMVGGEQRFCPVIWSRNHLLKPHVVMVGDKEEVHPEGYYSIEWREDGQRKREGVGNDPVVALNALRKREAILQGRALGLTVETPEEPQRQGGPLLADAVAAYLGEVRSQKKNQTYRAYALALECFRQSCKKEHLAAITREDLLNYATYLRKLGLSPRTVANRFNWVKIFLKNRKATVEMERGDRPRYTEPEPEIYEKDELEALFAACNPDAYMYFQFFLKTGMREQEVMHITWSSVNLKAGEVRVQANPRYGFIPKTYAERTIPIPDDLVEQLKEWKKKRGDSACPLVFPTGKCRPNGDFLALLKGIALRAGLNCGQCENKKGMSCESAPICEKWFLHKFRATFCTTLLWKGIDLRTVQSYMGHKDLESTMRYLKPNRGKEVRDKINAAFD